MQIKGRVSIQNGIKLFVGVMPFSQFVEMKKKNVKVVAFQDKIHTLIPQGVEEISEETKNAYKLTMAYQREEDKKKVHSIAKSILAGELCPLPIILGDREGKCILTNDTTCSINGLLTCPDGQHKAAGVVEAYEKNPDLTYDINVIIVLGSTMEQETNLFLNINKNATKVKKDLLINQHTQLDILGIPQTLTNKEKKELEACIISHMLNHDLDSPLRGWIRETGSKTGGTKQCQWIRGLLFMIDTVNAFYGETLTREEKRRLIATVVKTYYSALKILMPKSFVVGNEYRLLTNATGVNMMLQSLAMNSNEDDKSKRQKPMGIFERVYKMGGGKLLSKTDLYVGLIKGTRYTNEQNQTCPWAPNCEATETIHGAALCDAHAIKFLNTIDEMQKGDKSFLEAETVEKTEMSFVLG